MIQNNDDVFNTLKQHLERLGYVIQPIMYRMASTSNIYMQILIGGLVPILYIIIDSIRHIFKNYKSGSNMPKAVQTGKLNKITIQSFKNWQTFYNETYIFVSNYINILLNKGEYESDNCDILITKTVGSECEPYQELQENSWLTIKYEGKLIYLYHQTINAGVSDKANIDAAQTMLYKSYTIDLYCESLELISSFIDHCRQYHNDKKKQDTNIYSFEYIINNKNGVWISSNINIHKKLNDLFLPKKLYNDLRLWVNNFMTKDLSYISKRTVNKMGICLHGIPGCGKSTIPYAIANEYKMNIREITRDIFLDPNTSLQQIFADISNCIVLIEEIDTLEFFNKRDVFKKGDNTIDDDSDSGSFDVLMSETNNVKSIAQNITKTGNNKTDKYKNKKEQRKCILGTMLKVLDGYKYLSGCIVVMTTNDIDAIDPAIIRPGRIDHMIELTYADSYQIHNIFKYYFDDYNIDDNIVKNMVDAQLTTSYIINTLVLPNIGFPENAIADYV